MTLQLPPMTPCWCSIMKAAALLPDPSAPCTPQAVKTRSTTTLVTGVHASASWLTSLVEEMIRTWASAAHPHSTCVPGLVLCVGSFTRLMWVMDERFVKKKKKRLAAPRWLLKPLETNGPKEACQQLEFRLTDIMNRVVALCPRTWPVWGCSGCEEVWWWRAAAAVLQTLIYSWISHYSSAGLKTCLFVHCFDCVYSWLCALLWSSRVHAWVCLTSLPFYVWQCLYIVSTETHWTDTGRYRPVSRDVALLHNVGLLKREKQHLCFLLIVLSFEELLKHTSPHSLVG